MSLGRSSICLFSGVVAAASVAPALSGAVTLIKDDFSAWESAAGSFSTCDFTGFPEWTIITHQYSDLRVSFTGPAPNLIHYGGNGIYTQDEWGLNANGVLELTFLEPVYAVAGHGPGKWKYKLYLGDSLVGETFSYLGGPGDFAGVISDIAFDRVQFEPGQFNGIMFMDNVYFSAIPAPGAMVVLALGSLGFGRRARR